MKKNWVPSKGAGRDGENEKSFFIFFSAGGCIRGQNFIFLGRILRENWGLCLEKRKKLCVF